MIYKFDISEDTIVLNGSASAVSGSVGYYCCEFSFSHEWDELSKFAVFMCGDDVYTVEITDNSCTIPTEVISNAGTVTVGVYGSTMRTENPVRISTDLAHIIIKEGAYREGTAPEVPSADLWEIYFERAAEEAKRVAIDSGTVAADAAKQGFADTLGDIEAALDNIISIQNALIGGESV
ncbi:MAG: hypothetical protein IJN62_00750 [Clostridia bacterium]|nr:hypothetical protein [Clostridia bacterium]